MVHFWWFHLLYGLLPVSSRELCNECFNTTKTFSNGELIFSGEFNNLQKNENPLVVCSKICHNFNQLKEPYISNAVVFMDGDCYCLVNNDKNKCTNFQPSCPRNKDWPCDKYNMSNFCKPSSFFVLPHTFPPSENKKLQLLKIVKEKDAIFISNLECKRTLNIRITKSQLESFGLIKSELECLKLCLSPNHLFPGCFSVRYNELNKTCAFFGKIQDETSASQSNGSVFYICDLSEQLYQDVQYKVQLDGNLPIIVPFKSTELKSLKEVLTENITEFLPSVEFELPPTENVSFRYHYPIYLEPGMHSVEVTQTSVISILNFNEAGNLTIPNTQKQEFYIEIVSKIRDVELTKNSTTFVAIGTTVTIRLMIGHGSSMDIHFSEVYNRVDGIVNQSTFHLTTDILEQSFGVPKKDIVSTNRTDNGNVYIPNVLILLEKTWYNGSNPVVLSTVQVNVNETGILKLCVIKKVSPTNEDIDILADIKLNKTGLQVLFLRDFFAKPVYIPPGSAIGVLYKDAKYAKINTLWSQNKKNVVVLLRLENTPDSLLLNRNVLPNPNPTPTPTPNPNPSPLDHILLQMRFYYTTPLQYTHIVTKSNPGDVRVSVDVSNSMSEDPIKQSMFVQYQEPVNGLSFAENEPPLDVIIKNNIMNQAFVGLSVTVSAGSHLRYVYHVTNELKGFNKTFSQKDVTVVVQDAGVYHVIATVSNDISNGSISTSFNVFHEVGGLTARMVDPSIRKGATGSVEVELLKGTNVTINVLFGDFNWNATPLFVSEAYRKHQWNYKFSVCGVHTITVNASNKVSQLQKTTQIKVLCQFNNLVLTAIPVSGLKQTPRVQVDQYLTLRVSLTEGSFALFQIDWGDESNEKVIDNQAKTVPTPFERKHRYTKSGNYTVRVNGTNNIGQINGTIFVQVVSCTDPTVQLEYGSSDQPTTYTRKDSGIVLLATVFWNQDPKCRGVNKELELMEWEQTKSGTKAEGYINTISEEKIDRSGPDFVLNYTMTSMSFGDYQIVLRTRLYKVAVNYTAHIRIVKEDLYVYIVGDMYRGVRYEVDQVNGDKVERVFNNFTVDGSKSKDPNIKDQSGLQFSWSCRRLTTGEFEDKPYKCNSSEFEQLNDTGNVLQMSTKDFARNLTYEFHINVSSDGVAASYFQKVEILPGNPPEIILTCFSNCKRKVNTKEKLSIQYHCKECPTNIRLIATWVVTEVNSSNDKGIPWTHANRTTTGFNEPNIVFKEHSLKEQTKYQMNLTAHFETSPQYKAYFLMSYETSLTPINGSCIVSPLAASVITEFKFNCRDWKNNDRPIRYQFYYVPGTPISSYTESIPSVVVNESLKLLNPGTSELPQVESLLPLGLENQNYNVTLISRVSNEYGQYAEIQHIVQVLPVTVPKNPSGNQSIESVSKQSINKLLYRSATTVRQYSMTAVVVNSLLNEITSNENDEDGGGGGGGEEIILEKLSAEPTGLKEQQHIKEEKLAYVQQIKQSLLSNMAKQEVKNIDEFKVMTDAMSDITQNNINNASVVIAEDMLRELLSKLEDFIDKDATIGAKQLQQAMNSTFNVVSNTMVQNQEPNSSTLFLSAKLISQSLDLLLTRALAGEEKTTGSTEQFNFRIEKRLAYDLSLQNFTDDGGEGVPVGFVLPKGTVLFNGTDFPKGELGVTKVDYKYNRFLNEAEKSEYQTSTVSSFAIKLNAQELNITRLTSPIQFTLKSSQDDVTESTINMSLPGQFYYANVRNIPSSSCNMIVSVAVGNMMTYVTDDVNMTLHFYVKIGRPPMTSDFDLHQEFELSRSASMHNFTRIKFTTDKEELFRELDIGSFLLSNLSFFPNNQSQSIRDIRANTSIHFAFTYDGPVSPLEYISNKYTYDLLARRSKFGLKLRSYCAECKYWNKANSQWQTDGVELDLEKTTVDVTACRANHLTAFGNFYVSPNPLRPISLAEIREGFLLLCVMVSILMVYLVGLLFTRRADRNDVTKVGVTPLLDNNPEDRYLYEISVRTGGRAGAGTESNVFINVKGDMDETGVRQLHDNERKTFQQSSTDVFVMATPHSLGDLVFIHLWNDNKKDGWYVRNVDILDLQTDQKFTFIVGRWLSVEHNDAMSVECIVPIATTSELQDFNYLFVNNTKKEMADSHIWLSIYARPPTSPFTRCQRLSVAVSLVLTVMLANIIYFGRQPHSSPGKENKIAGFSFTWQEVYVGFIGALITIPVNIILVGLFKTIQPAPKEKKRSHRIGSSNNGASGNDNVRNFVSESSDSSDSDSSNDDDDAEVNSRHGGGQRENPNNDIEMHPMHHQETSLISGNVKKASVHLMIESRVRKLSNIHRTGKPSKARSQKSIRSHRPQQIKDMVRDNQRHKSKKKTHSIKLPHWMIYPTWALCLLTIFGSAFLIVWYGFQFGNMRSLAWLTTVAIGIVQDVLLMQPMKVFIMSLVVAKIYKKIEDKESDKLSKDAKKLAKDERWLHRQEAKENSFLKRVNTESLKPPTRMKLRKLRQIRFKELKMKSIFRELVLYLVYAVIVSMIGYFARDHSAFLFTRGISEMFTMHLRSSTRPQKEVVYTYKCNETLAFGREKYRNRIGNCSQMTNETERNETVFKVKKMEADDQRTLYPTVHRDMNIWDYFESVLLPQLYPTKWLDKVEPRFKDDENVRDFPGKLFLNDLNTKLLTGARIRQLRSQKVECGITNSYHTAKSTFQECHPDFDSFDQEKRDYLYDWTRLYDYPSDLTNKILYKPWQYHTWDELDTYPIPAEYKTYSGGGYVAELFPKGQLKGLDNQKFLNSLKKVLWIDRYTRAVIVEFALFNPATSYFQSVNIIFEKPATGGVVLYNTVLTFKLYRYTSSYTVFVILSEILFLLYTLLFIIREGRLIARKGWQYFKSFWDLIEFSNLVLSCTAVALYVYRDFYSRKTLREIPLKVPQRYINLYFAAQLDFLLTYMIALICFCVTIKFIKLLRFNKRISMLSSTLHKAWQPLSMFGITFGVVLVAFTLLSTLTFGKDLEGYKDATASFASIVSLLLGKFSYYQFESVNGVLGPAFFFAFNIFVNWIVMNMYISILNDSISEVRFDVAQQTNEYEMIDYTWDKLKGILGFHGSNRSDEIEKGLEQDHSLPLKEEEEENYLEGDGGLSYPDSARSTTNLIHDDEDEAETSFTDKTTTMTSTNEKSSATKPKQRKRSATVGGSNKETGNLLTTHFGVGDDNDGYGEPRKRKSSTSYEIRSRRISQRKQPAAGAQMLGEVELLANDENDGDEETFTQIEKFQPLIKRRSATFVAPNIEMLQRPGYSGESESIRKTTGTDSSAIKESGTTPREVLARQKYQFPDNDVELPPFYSDHDSINSVISTERIVQNLKKDEERAFGIERAFTKKKIITTRPSNLSTASGMSTKSHVTLKDLDFHFDVAEDDIIDENEAGIMADKFLNAVKAIYIPTPSSGSGSSSMLSPFQSTSHPLRKRSVASKKKTKGRGKNSKK